MPQVIDLGFVRLLKQGGAVQGGMYVGRPWRVYSPYEERFHLGPRLCPQARHAAFIGLGAGEGPRSFLHRYPEMRITAVEIDPEVVRICRERFDLPDDPRLDVRVGDGRAYLAQGRPADLLILDVFSEGELPYHLYTVEAMLAARRCLRRGGYLLANVIAAVGSPLFRRIHATMRQAFSAVYALPLHWRWLPLPGMKRNIVLVAGEPADVPDPDLYRGEVPEAPPLRDRDAPESGLLTGQSM